MTMQMLVLLQQNTPIRNLFFLFCFKKQCTSSMKLFELLPFRLSTENTDFSFQTLHILSLKRQFYNCNCYVSCNIDVTYICQLANKTVTKWHGWVIVLDLFLGINIQVTIVFLFLSLKLGFRRIQLLLCLQLMKTPWIQCVCVCSLEVGKSLTF